MSASPGTLAVVEIGGTSVKIGFAVNDRPVDFARTSPTARIRSADPASDLATLVRQASGEAGLSPAEVVATVPGFIGRDFDTVLHAANVPELDGHKIASELSAALAIPVRLERDVVLQLLGEARAGAVAGETEILGVYIGTGIGAAYLGSNGIFRGGGWALEIGHVPMRLTSPGFEPERLEASASGAALVALAARHRCDVRDLFRRPAEPLLEEALRTVVCDQAIAIAAAVALFSPPRVLIGGGVVEMDGYPKTLLAGLIAKCAPLGGSVQPPDILYARLGWQAAIWGAIAITQTDRSC